MKAEPVQAVLIKDREPAEQELAEQCIKVAQGPAEPVLPHILIRTLMKEPSMKVAQEPAGLVPVVRIRVREPAVQEPAEAALTKGRELAEPVEPAAAALTKALAPAEPAVQAPAELQNLRVVQEPVEREPVAAMEPVARVQAAVVQVVPAERDPAKKVVQAPAER